MPARRTGLSSTLLACKYMPGRLERRTTRPWSSARRLASQATARLQRPHSSGRSRTQRRFGWAAMHDQGRVKYPLYALQLIVLGPVLCAMLTFSASTCDALTGNVVASNAIWMSIARLVSLQLKLRMLTKPRMLARWLAISACL